MLMCAHYVDACDHIIISPAQHVAVRHFLSGFAQFRGGVGEPERVCGRGCIDQNEPQMSELIQMNKMRHKT